MQPYQGEPAAIIEAEPEAGPSSHIPIDPALLLPAAQAEDDGFEEELQEMNLYNRPYDHDMYQ